MITPAATGYMNLARIARTHGRKGEVVARPCDDLPFLLSVGMEVWLTPPDWRLCARTRVRSIRPSSQGMIVAFEGVDTIDAAEAIVSKCCLVRQAEVNMAAVAQAPVSVLDAEVRHAELGRLGVIVEVLQTKAHDVWVVDTPVGEVLLPICDEVITSRELENTLSAYVEHSTDSYAQPACNAGMLDNQEREQTAQTTGIFPQTNNPLTFTVRLIPGLLTNEQTAALSFLNQKAGER